jgi:hypothetical protein
VRFDLLHLGAGLDRVRPGDVALLNQDSAATAMPVAAMNPAVATYEVPDVVHDRRIEGIQIVSGDAVERLHAQLEANAREVAEQEHHRVADERAVRGARSEVLASAATAHQRSCSWRSASSQSSRSLPGHSPRER